MSQRWNIFSTQRLGRSPSIESCFPAMTSSDASACNEDYDININIEQSDGEICDEDIVFQEKIDHEISPSSPDVYPASPLLPEISTPSPSISDVQSSPQPLQTASNLTTILEVIGSDAQFVLNPSLRQDSLGCSSINQSANFGAKLTAQAVDDFPNFPLDTVPYSGAVSGELRSSGLKTHVGLYVAALKGDWKRARNILDSHPQAVSARITRGSETALHIAAGARHTRFVEELVNLMTPDDLALQNKVGNTALCFAAASGITRIAEVMVNKNKELPLIRGSKGALPLYMAALLGHRDMVWYLYTLTEDDLRHEDRVGLLIAAITSNLFDVALDMAQQYPELAISRDGNGDTPLHVLARKPSAFYSGSQLGPWQRCIYPFVPILRVLLWKVPKCLDFKDTYNKWLMHTQALELVKQLWHQVLFLDDLKIGDLIRTPSRLLFTASELGIVEFIVVLIRSYPDLIWRVDDKGQSIFHVAVAHRQENIFNLIYEIGALKDLIAAYKDENNNNMLHLAGKLAPSNRLKTDSGAALQLRRELHWFKEVEKIVQPLYTEMKDSEGRTPQVLFTEEHKSLLCEGEKWMKDTASSCMLVATLIATVMFAAAFTVPGGKDDATGRLKHMPKTCFMFFVITDALALFSSATSILIFLSILTSRYAEEDFLDLLPNRLVMGLATLFISIATMMISFCATLFVLLEEKWVGIPMAVVACIPVTLFAMLHSSLLVDVVSHTYWSAVFPSRNQLL